MMFADRLSLMRLSKISTLSLAITSTPDPAGIAETAVPSAAKFSVLFATTSLSNTRVVDPCWLRPGRLNTRMPPVLLVTRLPYTSASNEFSTSMPATLNSARLLRTMMLFDWPT